MSQICHKIAQVRHKTRQVCHKIGHKCQKIRQVSPKKGQGCHKTLFVVKHVHANCILWLGALPRIITIGVNLFFPRFLERLINYIDFSIYSGLSFTLEQTSELHLRKPMGAVSVFTTGNYQFLQRFPITRYNHREHQI